MEDVKKLLLQHSKITIADIQKCAPKNQIRLSKYSRHAQLISNEISNSSTQNLDLMLKLFKLMIERLSTDNDLQEMVVRLLSMMYKDQCPTNLGDFNIPDSVRIELMTLLKPSYETCAVNQIHRGILVPLTSSLYFDILSSTDEKPKQLRAILVNRVVYGDTIGDSKTIQVREVLTRKQLEINIELVENYGHLSVMRVGLIIHYGELPPALVDFCAKSNILMLPVPDYETLSQVQQMLRFCSILFDVEKDMSSDKDIVEVCLQCHTQQLRYQTKLDIVSRRVTKDVSVCGFVQLQPFQPQKEPKENNFYYTVLLYGRGPDLALLRQEAFQDLLNRIRYLLKVGSFVNEPVENQMSCLLSTTILEQDVNIDFLLECTPWIMTDIKLFSNDICQHLLEVFQGFQRKFYRSAGNELLSLDILEYKETLWKRSLECVNRIINTVDVKEFSL